MNRSARWKTGNKAMNDGTMVLSGRLERLRADIQAANFKRLSNDEAIALQRQYSAAHRARVERGDIPPTSLIALFALFVEEKVPPHISAHYVENFLKETETV